MRTPIESVNSCWSSCRPTMNLSWIDNAGKLQSCGKKLFSTCFATPHNEDIAPDLSMIERLRTGDEKAFNALYRHYHERLYYFALRFVEEADAKDVVSEAFIALWNKRTDFDSMNAVQHFLFVLVRNKCFYLLKHALMKMDKQAELLHQLETAGETDLELEHLTTELVKHIYTEADALPPRLKSVFLLSFAEGLKPAEIAERLGVSVQTVSNQKLRAIRVLKVALGQRHLLLSMLVILHGEG
jgi:RNA polymerase sigma-70 factor (family 1)